MRWFGARRKLFQNEKIHSEAIDRARTLAFDGICHEIIIIIICEDNAVRKPERERREVHSTVCVILMFVLDAIRQFLSWVHNKIVCAARTYMIEISNLLLVCSNQRFMQVETEPSKMWRSREVDFSIATNKIVWILHIRRAPYGKK